MLLFSSNLCRISTKEQFGNFLEYLIHFGIFSLFFVGSLSGDEQEETTTEPASESNQSILMPSSSNSIPISVSSSQVLEPSILDMNEVDGSISTSSTAKIFTKMSTTSEPMISETSLNPGNPGNNPGNPGISQSSSSNQSRSLISTSTIAATSGGGSEAIISTTKTEQSFLGK